MFQTANMGLTVWDQPTDDFNYQQLLANWELVDTHDHSGGKGAQITSAGLAANSVTATQIAPLSVGNSELGPVSVGTANIQLGAITSALIAGGAITGSLLAAGSVGANALDPTIIPLGSIMPWWMPSGAGLTPGGFWEAMDGRPWNDITNAWGLTVGNIPDTRGFFVKGADYFGSAGPAIGTTGGSANASLAHTHSVLGHTHTVPSHTHPISTDGSHLHLWQGGLSMGTRTNAFNIGVTVPSSYGGQIQNTYYTMYIRNLLSNPAWEYTVDVPGEGEETTQVIDGQADMDNAGLHSHGGATQGSAVLNSGSSTATTNSQLGSTTIDPPWNAFMYIMRCR